jgi:hypothetical protein
MHLLIENAVEFKQKTVLRVFIFYFLTFVLFPSYIYLVSPKSIIIIIIIIIIKTIQLIYLSACQQRVVLNRRALNTYVSRARLRLK